MAKRGEATGRPVTALTVFAIPGGGERASLLARTAEDVLAQAEEANAVDPVG